MESVYQNGEGRPGTSVLCLAPYPPFLDCPPLYGGALHVIKNLTALGNTGRYRISLFLPAASPDHVRRVAGYLKGRRGFQKVWGVVCDGDLSGGPGDAGAVPDGAMPLYRSRAYREVLTRVLKENPFDIVVLETSYMLWPVSLIRELQPEAKIVLDLQNAEHLLWRRMAENGGLVGDSGERCLKEYRKTLEWEKRYWPRVDYCMSVSPLESRIFSAYAPNIPVGVVVAGGGVSVGGPLPGHVPAVSPGDLSFVGGMWYPNVHGLFWFVEKVFPLVEKPFPRARLHIVGAGKPPGSLLKMLKARGKSVVFWGQQEDERIILAGAGVFVVPLFIGAGARIKIMTAWSLGIPVVSTSIGAEGLYCNPGRDILIADTPDGFTSCVTAVLADYRLREKLVRNGKDTVCRMYSEAVAAEKVIRFFNRVAAHSAAAE